MQRYEAVVQLPSQVRQHAEAGDYEQASQEQGPGRHRAASVGAALASAHTCLRSRGTWHTAPARHLPRLEGLLLEEGQRLFCAAGTNAFLSLSPSPATGHSTPPNPRCLWPLPFATWQVVADYRKAKALLGQQGGSSGGSAAPGGATGVSPCGPLPPQGQGSMWGKLMVEIDKVGARGWAKWVG